MVTFDLCSIHNGIIEKNSSDYIMTSISITPPKDKVANLIPGKDLTKVGGIQVEFADKTCNMSGLVGIIVHNHADHDLHYKKNDGIGKMTWKQIYRPMGTQECLPANLPL
jgi:dUTPase